MTSPLIRDVESAGALCTLAGDLRPLVGVVRIDVNDQERVWIERADHTRASVLGPTGFRLDRRVIAVRDVVDAIVVEDGSEIEVMTLNWQAEGTSSDPFTLRGVINGRHYGVVR
jgi:hypothetical protein